MTRQNLTMYVYTDGKGRFASVKGLTTDFANAKFHTTRAHARGWLAGQAPFKSTLLLARVTSTIM